jgi:hypothetical protein
MRSSSQRLVDAARRGNRAAVGREISMLRARSACVGGQRIGAGLDQLLAEPESAAALARVRREAESLASTLQERGASL